MYRYKKSYRVKKLQPAHRFLPHRRRGPLKSIFLNRFFWLAILVLIILGGIFYLICFFSTFQIKEIRISGNQKVSTENLESLIKEKVKQRVLFSSSESIFLVNLNKINEVILEKFPQIAQVSLSKKFPDVLLVQIEERKPLAIFCQNTDYFLMDKEGIIFEEVFQVSPQVLKIKNLTLTTGIGLGDIAVKKEELIQILEIESKLKTNLKILLKEISIISEERFTAITSEGWEIYFNPKEDLNWQLTKLSAVLEEEIPPERRKDLEYIELRFGNLAPYKYRSD